ncbi:VCBS repeat-containing protein [Elioraea sp.]|uniref:FG-GAP repeat domain-containing protein n=1 Tax=Elioraea sp. TaxID=2185103 RepID=UPI0025C516CD|nr:VCBS repeat-containing protein [Elioraea sp.]
MALRISFGQGGAPTQWYLPGTDTTLLPPGPPGGQPPVADALTDGPYAPGWDDTPLFGGLVEADTVGGTAHSFDVVGGWNSVKNAFAQSDEAEELRFDGFVQVDIAVGSGDPGGASIITVIGAKRGNIVTGAGDDIIRVEVLSNEGTWNNEFRINAGAGDDVVTITGLDRDRELAGGDTTYASFVGTGGTWNTSGGTTATFVDLGDGNDRFIGHGSDDTVTGGAGDDLADGGGGTDVWVLTGTQDGYRIAWMDGRYIVTDIDHSANGNDGRDDIGGFERVRFGDGTELTLTPPPGLTLWNRLGDAREAVESEIGPDGTLAGGTFVPGVFGGAWRATSTEATEDSVAVMPIRGVSFPSSVINAASGTIEFWARLEGFSGGMGANAHPGLITTAPISPGDGTGHWNMGFTGNDGGGGYGFVGQAGDANFTGTNARFSPPTFEEILGGQPADWHHFALSWTSDGFGALGQPDRETMLFIDGVPVSEHWEERVLRGFTPEGEPLYGTGALVPPFGDTLVLAFTSGPGWPSDSAIEFDNLKVWNIARTDFSDRFDEDAGAPPPTDTASLTFADIANGVGGFKVIAETTDLYPFRELESIGDLNGDGRGEILIAGGGAAYVVWGKTDGVPVALADVGNGIGGFKVYHDDFYPFFAASVAAIADRNDDGLQELLIGEAGMDGAAYVVWGKGDGEAITREDIWNYDGGYTAFRGYLMDYAGFGVGAIADLGGDGLEELIISAWPNLEDFPTPGLIYVDGDGGFRVVGSNEGDGITYEATLGDTNGDGREDLLANGYHGAYVVWGRSDRSDVSTNDLAAGTGGFVIPGAQGSGGIDDLNGDGLAEILAVDAQNAYVIWGKADGAAVALADIAAGNGGFVVTGARSLASLGADVNGDGRHELLAHDAAASYVLFGKDDGDAVSLADVAAGIGGFQVFGDGAAFAPSGDMNGDGVPELLTSMPAGADPASAFVLLSTAAWLHEG